MRPLFDLGQVWDQSGVTLREHLQASVRATGRVPDRLDVPPIPDVFARGMDLWLDMHRGREPGFGLAPFSWRDFQAFVFVTGERLTLDDIDLLRIIEEEFFNSREAAETSREGREKAQHADRARN